MHTSKFKSWKINTAIAFTNKGKALAFEKYLKTHSGRAFAKNTFITNVNKLQDWNT